MLKKLKENILASSYEDRAGRSVISVKSLMEIIDRLAEKCLILELPCKEGDKVYIIAANGILEQKILGYKISSADGIEIYTLKRILYVSDFGKTVFLTRSEAEKELEKMGGKL